MVEEVFVSTDLVDVGQRCDFWREITKPVFETQPCPEDRGLPLEGSVRSHPIGPLLTASTTFNRQQYSRDRRIVLQSGLDGYLVQLLTSGTLAGDFNGVDVSAGPGDIFIMDLARTLESRVGEGSRITFSIPRQPLEKAVNWRNLHGTVLKGHWPITQLVMACLTGLHSVGGQLPSVQAAAAQEAVVTLLAAALKGEMPDTAAGHSVLGIALRQRILAFIDQNIKLPELSPDLIIRRFNVSRSHLYRTFAADGGVAKVLRNKRLDAAFLALTRADSPSASITEIAYRLGFSSGNQLLRAFRARFGLTPSQAREKAGSWGDDRSGPDLLAHFADLRDRAAAS